MSPTSLDAAHSTALAWASLAYRPVDHELSALLALAAAELHPGLVARGALLHALHRSPERTLPVPVDQPVRLAISPDGRWLVTCDGPGKRALEQGPRLVLVDLETGRQHGTTFEPGELTDLAFDPDTGELFVLMVHRGLARQQPGSATWRTLEVAVDTTMECMQVRDGRAYLGTARGDLLVVDTTGQTEGLRIHLPSKAMLATLALSPDGTVLMGGDVDGHLWRWDTVRLRAGEAHLDTMGQLPDAAATLCFSPDGRDLAVAFGPHLALGPVATMALEVRNVGTVHGDIEALCWGIDGLWVSGPEGLALYTDDGPPTERYPTPADAAQSGLVVQGGSLWSVGLDGRVRAREPGGGPAWLSVPLEERQLADPTRVSTPDGTREVRGTEHGGIEVIDTETGAPTGFQAPRLARTPAGQPTPIRQVLVSSDGARFWAVPEAGPIWTAPVRGGPPQGIALPEGERGPAVLLADDVLFIGLDDAVVGLKLATGALLGQLPMDHRGSATALLVEPDGRTLWTGHEGGGLQLWDLGHGEPLGPFVETYMGDVAALSLEGDKLVLIDINGDTQRYAGTPSAQAALLARSLGRRLDAAALGRFLP